jgi:hypothetical protein
MTKAEADGIGEAISDIECGRVEMGVRFLRTLISASGHKPPPARLIEAREPKRKQQQEE